MMKARAIAAVLAATIIVLATIYWRPRAETHLPASPLPKNAAEQSTVAAASPLLPDQERVVAPSANGTAPRPAEAPRLRSSPASRERIAAAATGGEVRELHRVLSGELIGVLEGLVATEDEDRIKVATQDLADRFYLLDRVVKTRGLATPGAGSVGPGDAARLAVLQRVWQENMALSLTVDRLFKERGILVDEHVPQALRRWLEEGLASRR